MPKFQSLIIVTYGRSGSTLLQGILNTMPGFLVRGENKGIAEGLFIAWDRLQKTMQHKGPRTDMPSHPWFGARSIDRELFLGHLRDVMRDMLVPAAKRDEVTCFGFKEIRYPSEPKRFADYIAFLRSVMPETAVVINTRSLEKTAKSGWWAERPEASVIKQLAKSEANFLEYAQANPAHSFHIKYEDVCERNDRLRALHEFLGMPYVPEAIDRVLSVTHSNITAVVERKRKKQAGAGMGAGPGMKAGAGTKRGAGMKAKKLEPAEEE